MQCNIMVQLLFYQLLYSDLLKVEYSTSNLSKLSFVFSKLDIRVLSPQIFEVYSFC